MISVVVVDDSLILRRNISKMLTDLGYQVVAEAKDGNDAIVNYTRHSPDLMTMDITMPDMDGITAVKEIKRISHTAKIIMVTSHGQEDMVISAIKAGASGYILKPVTADKLEKAIEKVFPDIKKIKDEQLQAARAANNDELVDLESGENSSNDEDDDLKVDEE
jgi:two-component system, chemotaxis family, chemotaxis protein CheY